MSRTSQATLGETDAWPRWWGVWRHQLVLGIVCVVVGADALVRPGSRWWEWAICGLAGGGASPAPGAATWAQRSVSEVGFLLRRRIRWISLEVDDDVLSVQTLGVQRVWCYEFTHRGRLDLSGRDAVLAARLARMVESFAQSGERAHVALHVDTGERTGARARTALSVNVGAPVPSEWRPQSAAGVPRSLSRGKTALIERRHYVRTPHGVVRTLRVADFAAGRASAALETLGEYGSGVALSLHADVMPLARARRVTSRAVHRVGTDAEFARGAGFRWSARDQTGLDALRQREEAVARGAALCRWALYVVVSAPTTSELRDRVRHTRELARTAGLRLDAGVGVQGPWFAFQLPGGPGW